jgi:hypothetical protein
VKRLASHTGPQHHKLPAKTALGYEEAR